MRKPIFVLDTNIIIDYVDVIPSDDSHHPENPTIDLSSAHIVIPTTVIRELSNFKKEKSDRGRIARLALNRIRQLVENAGGTMEDYYCFNHPITCEFGSQTLSILPIHKNFCDSLPYHPSDDDMDGQIILAALSVAFSLQKCPIDGTGDYTKVNPTLCDVTLLTNDNGLATRAAARGLKTSRFGYKYPKPYSGRRDLTVPAALFEIFWQESRIDLDTWRQYMPNEPELITNEFIIMQTDTWPCGFDPKNDPYFSNIGRYDSEEQAIVKLRYANDFPANLKNAGQAIYAEDLLDPNLSVVICTGPAGTGKTYLASLYSLDACQNGKYIGIAVVPCYVEDTVGFLPGNLDEKMSPHVQPIKNAIQNYLLKDDKNFRSQHENLRKYGARNKTGEKNSNTQSQKSLKEKLHEVVDLTYQNWFGDPIPIEYARGRDFAYQIAIYDEFQDQNFRQADTLIKRLGEDGKIIITGDIEQIHAAYLDQENNGIVYASRLLMNNPMVARISFTEDEVVRHPLVKMIAKRQKAQK